jgi:DNA helicase IV
VPTHQHPAPDVLDPVLQAEQAHLAAARAALARMRDRTAALDSSAAGDPISEELLESALLRRMKALADDPTVPLFFGRIDYAASSGERFYVGRRHVSDAAGDPMVVDWRAPVSLAFYRGSRTEPMGVELRRRFGFVQGRLTGYEDEALIAGEGALPDAGGAGHSAILETEIERPRVGPMRDIVATIQPEQDVLVRADLADSVCVQGAPGTGKTAVGLHRAAFLLYAHREQLSRQGVLVVGPNASFLRYIGDVLPALGEVDAQQSTIEALVARRLSGRDARLTVRGVDDPAVATLKGDARLATVLRRALWSQVRVPAEGLLVPRGARRWRLAPYEVEEVVAELRSRGVRYGAARGMLAQRLAHGILVKMETAGDSPDDRVQDAVARSREVRRYVDATWPAVDPARLVLRLLSDPEALATAAEGVLDAEEQELLRWRRPPRSPASARWSLADAVLVDEVADLVDRTPSLGHVVADEAQDLSPMMLRAVGRRCSTGSTTVLGDLAQATTPWGARSWSEALGHLGKPDAHIEELTRGFRVPGEVIDYAARLLPVIAPTLQPPTSVRRARGELQLTESAQPMAAAAAAVAHVRATAEGSIGVIVSDIAAASASAALAAAGVEHTMLGDDNDVDALVDVVPASLAKGLEFDHVVLIEPAALVAGEADVVTGLRRLYVCLTRAVTSLVVVHSEPLPAALAALPREDVA